jgi:hypothetical protein
MLSDEQIHMIKNHCYFGNKFFTKMEEDPDMKVCFGVDYVEPYELGAKGHKDPWDIEETHDRINLSTFLDNFNMELFLKIIRAEDAII